MKRNILRALSVMLAALMLLGALASCNNDSTDSPSTSTDAETNAQESDALEGAESANITVNGVPLSKFVIKYATDDDYGKTDKNGDLNRKNDDEISVSHAAVLKKAIEESTGISLEVQPDTAPEAEYEIIIGKVDRDMVKQFHEDVIKNAGVFKVMISGKKIAILATTESTQKLAREEFEKTFFSGEVKSLALTDESSLVVDITTTDAVAISKRINDSDIRIASNNIYFHENSPAAFYKNRTTLLLQSFYLFDADVLMLQECGYDRPRTANNKTWHEILDPVLPTLGYTQVPVTLHEAAKYNYTPIWYRADKLELIESDYHLYSSVITHQPDSYLSDSKSYTMAVFQVKGTENKFACFSTHLTYASDATLANTLRQGDAREAVDGIKKIKETYGKDFPIFLMGDLNCTTGSQPYNILITELKNVNVYIGVKKNNTDKKTGHELGEYPKNGSAIDHTLISGKGFKPVQYQHVLNEWSINSTDHIPLLVDFTFN